MGRKRFIAGVIAAAAITSAATAVTAASSVSAAPTGIPNYLVSAIAIDQVNHTATLPLFQGEAPHLGRVWFILTESSNLADAERLGINWSPKLANALGTPAVQSATLEDGGGHSQFGRDSDVGFSAGVNFSGQRLVVPGPDLFPVDPATHAGPVGQQGYSPLFTFGDGVVFNGAEVANRTGVHPKVLSLDLNERQAVVHLTAGFYLGRNVLYLSTESSVTQIAALENATYAPALASAPQAGSDDPSLSAREAIIPVVNGPRGAGNPQRQGLQSAVAGEGDPLNIIREEPECSDPTVPANCSALEYSPLWDVHPVAWTQAAIDAGLRTRLTSHQQVEALFNQGLLVSAAPDGPVNHDPEIDGLRAAGVVVNCPPIFVAPPA
jgi:hypothetical protein